MNNILNETINPILLATPYYLNIYIGCFLWTIGNLGCIGNMIVYQSPLFRHQAYAIYLFGASICDFHYFNFVLVTRILQKGFRISLMNRYLVICKARQFCTIWGNVVSCNLYSLAIADRLLSTQRSMSKSIFTGLNLVSYFFNQ